MTDAVGGRITGSGAAFEVETFSPPPPTETEGGDFVHEQLW